VWIARSLVVIVIVHSFVSCATYDELTDKTSTIPPAQNAFKKSVTGVLAVIISARPAFDADRHWSYETSWCAR
jgi:hypothetical protein